MMKYLLIILLLFTSFSAFAQNDTTKYYTSTDYGWKWQRGMFKKAFILPSDTINNKLGVANIGARIYVGNGIFWIDITSVVHQVDTINLSHRIDLKFNTSDSIGKWLSQGYLSVINGKINIVDTAAILLAYKNNINSLILDSIYQASQITAIQSVLNSKLNISDTIGKWLGIGYLTILNSKLNKVDTIYFLHSSDIANKMNYGDSSLMLHPYLNKKDTIYFLHSSDIANFATTSSVSSALNLKVNNSDSTIKYVTPSQLNSKGYITSIDSSYNGFSTRKRLSYDSLVLAQSIATKGPGTVISIAADYGLTGGTITTAGTFKVDSTVILPLSSITLNSSGVIHTSPITFTRLGGAWSGQMTLASQSAYKVLGRASGSGTPSFLNLDSNYFNNLWYTYVRGSLSAGKGATFTNGAFGLDTTQPYTWLNNQVIKSNTLYPLNITNTFGTQLYNLDSSGNLSIKPGGSILFAPLGGTPAYISGTQYSLNFYARNAGGVHNFYNKNNPTNTSKLNMVIGGASYAIGGINELQVLQHYTGTQIMQLDSMGNMILGSGTATDRLQVTGNINISTVGGKLKIATGSNASVGTSSAIGSGGTPGRITVLTTAVTGTSKIFITGIDTNTGTVTNGALSVGTIVNATSFDINSSLTTDTRTVNWFIIN